MERVISITLQLTIHLSLSFETERGVCIGSLVVNACLIVYLNI
jgi:hypothetical protein